MHQDLLARAIESRAAGRLDVAENLCREHLRTVGESARAYQVLGMIQYDASQPASAIDSFRQALDLDPDFAAVHYNLGIALFASHQTADSVAAFRRAIELEPSFVDAWYNLGVVLEEQGDFDGAAACFQSAIGLKPDHAAAHSNLGNLLMTRSQYREAVKCYRRAVEVSPDFAHAHSNLGVALHQLADFGAEVDCYDNALAIEPEYAEAHLNRSICRLLKGDFERGWPEYEWRLTSDRTMRERFSKPAWQGEPLSGRTILLCAEQGFGDTLQFVRYARLVKEREAGARVVVECQKGMGRLLAEVAGADQVVEADGELPAFDVHCPLLSLPRIFGTTLETIPASVPYLFAEEGLVEAWGAKLLALCGGRRGNALPVAQGLSDLPWRIGINWRGRPGRGSHQLRDIPLEMFERLGELPRVRLVSLQHGEGREELLARHDAVGTAHPTVIDLGDDVDAASGAFVDTAAIMRNLDLVITSDTAVAHLAGALGVSVWVALPFVPDWRWLLERSDCPWYPTMRLFRQQRAGDWEGVFEEIRAALVEWTQRC